MMWDENKHPRDRLGRFTDGKPLAIKLEPNEEIEKAKKETTKNLRERLMQPIESDASTAIFSKDFVQEKSPEHNPDKTYVHQAGKIAGAERGAEMTFAEANSGKVNPYYKKGFNGYETNCQTCVATYFARRLGYDVRALPNFNNENISLLAKNTALAYINSDGKHPEFNVPRFSENDIDFLERTIKTNEIHALEFHSYYKKKGHIVVIERDTDGKLKIYDPQNNRVVKEKIQEYMSSKLMVRTLNLSDCTIDEKFADKIMKSNKRR